jgi:sulfur-oxidizing protein SoxZ
MTEAMKIRAVAKDGVTEVRVLMAHPMESGQRKDSAGNVLPAHYITHFVARHNGRVVLEMEMGTAVSTNPYLTFKFQGGAAGDTLTLRWQDNLGASREDQTSIS